MHKLLPHLLFLLISSLSQDLKVPRYIQRDQMFTFQTSILIATNNSLTVWEIPLFCMYLYIPVKILKFLFHHFLSVRSPARDNLPPSLSLFSGWETRDVAAADRRQKSTNWQRAGKEYYGKPREVMKHGKVGTTGVQFLLRSVTLSKVDSISYVYLKIKHLKTKWRVLYLKTQAVPRCKHFSSRL